MVKIQPPHKKGKREHAYCNQLLPKASRENPGEIKAVGHDVTSAQHKHSKLAMTY